MVINVIRKLWVKQPVRSFIIYITLGVIVASLCILLARTVLFKNLELLTLDMLFRLRGSRITSATTNIAIIEITSDDLQRTWIRKGDSGSSFFTINFSITTNFIKKQNYYVYL